MTLLSPLLRRCGLILALALPSVSAQADRISADNYPYPIHNPYAATIIGTPTEMEASLPELDDIPWQIERTRMLDNNVPELFWYAEDFVYTHALQDKPAPLVFIIGGTGAGHSAEKVQLLQRIFYSIGFHAVGLSSPTYNNFIVSALPSHFPGYVPDDTQALYQAMQHIDKELKEEEDMKVTGYHLTGYSLGGTHAGFVAHQDAREQRFNFERVMLLNPSVDLYRSVTILDNYIERFGVENVTAFIDGMVDRVAAKVRKVQNVDFADIDFIYRLYREDPLSDEEMQRLIGTSFRLSAMSLIFTADVMNDVGYVRPKGEPIDKYADLQPYALFTRYVSFNEYFEAMLLPSLLARDPNLSREQILANESLELIEPFLQQSEHISVLTNADDFILTESDVDFLDRTFGDRSRIFPYGGHMGNMHEQAYVGSIINFFQRGALQ